MDGPRDEWAHQPHWSTHSSGVLSYNDFCMCFGWSLTPIASPRMISAPLKLVLGNSTNLHRRHRHSHHRDRLYRNRFHR
jgi:hypothetical protein